MEKTNIHPSITSTISHFKKEEPIKKKEIVKIANNDIERQTRILKQQVELFKNHP